MDGIIVINKPKGCTSHDVVYKVKKMLKEKVGHTGTLDPMAEGVLPLLIGKGTQCSKYLINHDKKYQVMLKLGVKTDTADSEGKIIEEENVDEKILEENHVKETLSSFLGKQEQKPPMYSAIKVKGKKLYEYARNGQQIEVPTREIEIYSIEIIKIDKGKKTVEFNVKCSKGTYIRSLCEDIATKLGTIGYMNALKRLEVGEFKIKDSLTIEELEEKIIKSEKYLITIEEFFNNKKQIYLEEKDLIKFLNGVKLKNENTADDIYRIYSQNKFIGIGRVEKELLKRDIVLE